jgi:hypothetical protein
MYTNRYELGSWWSTLNNKLCKCLFLLFLNRVSVVFVSQNPEDRDVQTNVAVCSVSMRESFDGRTLVWKRCIHEVFGPRRAEADEWFWLLYNGSALLFIQAPFVVRLAKSMRLRHIAVWLGWQATCKVWTRKTKKEMGEWQGVSYGKSLHPFMWWGNRQILVCISLTRRSIHKMQNE